MRSGLSSSARAVPAARIERSSGRHLTIPREVIGLLRGRELVKLRGRGGGIYGGRFVVSRKSGGRMRSAAKSFGRLAASLERIMSSAVSSANQRSLRTNAQVPADERGVRFEALLGSPAQPLPDEAQVVIGF